jgi:hypothetical protein
MVKEVELLDVITHYAKNVGVMRRAKMNKENKCFFCGKLIHDGNRDCDKCDRELSNTDNQE